MLHFPRAFTIALLTGFLTLSTSAQPWYDFYDLPTDSLVTCVTDSAHELPRALVVSGGGARGAWGAGLASMLNELGYEYQYVVGTSTGSLMAPLILLEDYDRLEQAYTELTPKDIFNVRPFKRNGKIKGGKAFWRVLWGKPTLGQSENLRKRIDRFYSPEDHNAIRNANKSFTVTAVDFDRGDVVYRSSADLEYEEIGDWMWTSANQPLFMSFYEPVPGGGRFVDGGVKENVPIAEAVRLLYDFQNEQGDYPCRGGVGEIHVIVNHLPDSLKKSKEEELEESRKNRIIPNLLQTIDLFSVDVRENDIALGRVRAEDARIVVRVFYMLEDDFGRIEHSLDFDEEEMTRIWNSGSQGRYAEEHYILEKDRLTKVQ